jgi:hypothetical protein
MENNFGAKIYEASMKAAREFAEKQEWDGYSDRMLADLAMLYCDGAEFLQEHLKLQHEAYIKEKETKPDEL